MESYEYKCVAGPVVIAVKTAQQKAEAVKEYEAIINTQAQSGWEYHSSDSFQTAEPPGCGGGSAPIITTFKMLIFRRARSA